MDSLDLRVSKEAMELRMEQIDAIQLLTGYSTKLHTTKGNECTTIHILAGFLKLEMQTTATQRKTDLNVPNISYPVLSP